MDAFTEISHHTNLSKRLEEQSQHLGLLNKELCQKLHQLQEMQKGNFTNENIREKTREIENDYKYTIPNQIETFMQTFEKAKEDFINVLFWAKIGKEYYASTDTLKD